MDTATNCSHLWVDEQKITPHAWIARCSKCGATTINSNR